METMFWTFPHISGQWKLEDKRTLRCGNELYHVKRWDGSLPVVAGRTLRNEAHVEYTGTRWQEGLAVQQGESPECPKKADVWDTQVGGTHYTDMRIQPFQYSMANGLDPMQHTIVKYVSRFRAKGGIQDLEKAKQTLELLIAYEQEKK